MTRELEQATAAERDGRPSRAFEHLERPSEVYLSREGEPVDGKSIMSVMLLAAPVGSSIGLRVTGPDEEQAFALLKELVDDGFGERDD